jgi:nitrous oxidase accessory protein NosD
MSRLTALEAAVLNEICRQENDHGEALRAQVAAAIVTRRENSGAGFFTHLSVDRSLMPIMGGATVIGNVVARIAGFEAPLLFFLFMEDGYVEMLEGASVEDSTVGVDLSACSFTIDPA